MFRLGLPPPPSRPRSPVPKFRYIDDPASYRRNYAHSQMPCAGDFCIVKLDPIASLAHLGPEAMKLARRIPSEHYVAYVGMVSYSCGLHLQPKLTSDTSLIPSHTRATRQTHSRSPLSVKVYPQLPYSAMRPRLAFQFCRTLSAMVVARPSKPSLPFRGPTATSPHSPQRTAVSRTRSETIVRCCA